jgi:hypothetical protein
MTVARVLERRIDAGGRGCVPRASSMRAVPAEKGQVFR